MKKLIKILSYKRIKTDEVYDMVKIEDFAFAEISEESKTARILDGKYKGKFINPLDLDYEQYDFTYTELNPRVFTLGLDMTDDEIIRIAKEMHDIPYYYVNISNGRVALKECINEKHQIAFDQFVNPSVGAELEKLIEQMTQTGSNTLHIGGDLSAKMLGKTDSLEKQDENTYYESLADYNISDKYRELREIVIGQDEELKILLANLLKNISLSYSKLDSQKVKNLKSRILIMGGTGTGKTLMVESIADMLGVPYTLEDAKRYTNTGFVGEDVENMLVNLYNASGEDMEKFEHGIIFIDEIDKLCTTNNDRSHVATTDVQESLLKMIEGSKVGKKITKGFQSEHKVFDTSRITFVLAGAFDKYGNHPDYGTDSFLIQTGMIPELVSRLNTKIITKKPTREDLKTALTSSKYGYLRLLEEYLNQYGIELITGEDFIDEIVERAYQMDSGYRSLSKVLNEVVDEYLFDIFDGKINTLCLGKVNKDV